MIAMSIGGITCSGARADQPDLYLQPLRLVGLLPVYVVWALPTVGWLLLVSSWAKTKPFLWAVGVPLIALVLVKWISYTLENFSGSPLNIMPLAQDNVARLLGGSCPASGSCFTGGIPPMHQNARHRTWACCSKLLVDDPGHRRRLDRRVVCGAAMIFGAIRLRRWRDEG
jgi:ABC-2 type transport system permease protein